MELTVGQTYPILIDGDPAPAGLTWGSTVSGVVDITMGGPGDSLVVAVVIGAGDTTISTTEAGRSGSVDVTAVAAPLAITFGDPL